MTVQEIINRINECKTKGIGLQTCDCGEPITPLTIDMYPHEGGIKVDGETKKQWVYIHCRKCQYDWALWKLRMGLDPTREKET